MTDDRPAVATICSHSALQIFHGAKQEGLETVGICALDRTDLYESFPNARPDHLITVDDYTEILQPEMQQRLRDLNAVLVPHGSFVEYVGADSLRHRFDVPLFGNKETLTWESDRSKERGWLEQAGIRTPRVYDSPDQIDGPVIVKGSGAKGGEGYVLVTSTDEYHEAVPDDDDDYTIQEFISGTRYYPHYFYSPLTDTLEILGIDRRDETDIDESFRMEHAENSFVVAGNKPLAVRESLLPRIHEMGRDVVETAKELFPPGLYGPFCLETVCTADLEFVAFEISGRIVAGTNLYPEGSPYSPYYHDEPMSMGRRIAREIKQAHDQGQIDAITS